MSLLQNRQIILGQRLRNVRTVPNDDIPLLTLFIVSSPVLQTRLDIQPIRLRLTIQYLAHRPVRAPRN